MDGLFVNLNLGFEMDIDATYQVEQIKEIIFDTDEDDFYLLANKY